MYELHFPIWVRIISLFQRETNSGLTRAEEKHLAREYRRGAGRPLTAAEMRALRVRLEERNE